MKPDTETRDTWLFGLLVGMIVALTYVWGINAMAAAGPVAEILSGYAVLAIWGFALAATRPWRLIDSGGGL